MPQASSELAAKWGGKQGIGEDKAWAYLEKRGWSVDRFGLWWHNKPKEEVTKDEWEALSFLQDEWDYDYGGQLKGV